jgi:hypothetical protein
VDGFYGIFILMLSDDDFIKFMHSGSPLWKNKGFKDIEGKEYQMSGCYPTGDCRCNCHHLGVPFIRTSIPAQACCSCRIVTEKVEEGLYKIKSTLPEISPTEETLCDFHEQISTLEFKIKNLEQEIVDLKSLFSSYDERIHDLENISSEVRLIACEQNYPSLWKRIEKLEKENNHLLSFDGILELEGRINEIEPIVKQIFEWFTHNNMKTPHKCPVCLGIGNIYMDGLCSAQEFMAGWKNNAAGIGYKDCNSCKGKGIVWG